MELTVTVDVIVNRLLHEREALVQQLDTAVDMAKVHRDSLTAIDKALAALASLETPNDI